MNIAAQTDKLLFRFFFYTLDFAIGSWTESKLAVCYRAYCPWQFIISTAVTDAGMGRINGLLEALSKPPQARDMIK